MFVFHLFSPYSVSSRGQKSCQSGRLEVEVSRGLGLSARKGRAEGDHSLGTTNRKKGLWHSWMGDHGRKSLPSAGDVSGHKKAAEMEGGRMAGRGERPWDTGLPLLCLIPPVTASVLSFQNRLITSSSPLPPRHALSPCSPLHLTSLQTGGSTVVSDGSAPVLSAKHHSLEKLINLNISPIKTVGLILKTSHSV